MELILWAVAKKDPTRALWDYLEILESQQFQLSKEFVQQIFHSWRWSFKIPSFKQLHKYSLLNREYYYGFCLLLTQQTNWIRLKFMDEVHFVNKGKKFIFIDC